MSRASAFHRVNGASIVEFIHTEGGYAEVVEFNEKVTSVEEMMGRYHSEDWVKYAEPDYTGGKQTTAVVTDVETVGSWWNLIRVNLLTETQRNATEVVAISPQGTLVLGTQVVAVLDSGIHLGHEDLSANAFTGDFTGTAPINPPQFQNNPVDDQPPYPVSPVSIPSAGGHGTHVAGIIGAVSGNGVGVAGVVKTVRLLPIKILPASGGIANPDVSNTVFAAGIRAAYQKGARVINCSVSGTAAFANSQNVRDAITDAYNAGSVIVASAGNIRIQPPGGGSTGPRDPAVGINPNDAEDTEPNLDLFPVYPAASVSPNVITVANTNDTDVLNPTSKFGRLTVDLAAPGTGIRSTLNQNSVNAGVPYGENSGTSMSAPMVSGAVALARAKTAALVFNNEYPAATSSGNGPFSVDGAKLNVFELLDRVRMGVVRVPTLYNGALPDYSGSVSTGGRLDVYNAVGNRPKLVNLSCRGRVEGSDTNMTYDMYSGFVLRHETTIVVRGSGPLLTAFGVPGAIANPKLELRDVSGNVIVANDNYTSLSAADQSFLAQKNLTPYSQLESAIVRTLPRGSYTARLTSADGSPGEGLCEVYEFSSPDSEARAINMSTRLMVRNSGPAIFGMIVSGNVPRRVLIRTNGPILTEMFGMAGLNNPKIDLFQGSQPIASSDSWKSVDTSSTSIYVNRILALSRAPFSESDGLIIGVKALWLLRPSSTSRVTARRQDPRLVSMVLDK